MQISSFFLNNSQINRIQYKFNAFNFRSFSLILFYSKNENFIRFFDITFSKINQNQYSLSEEEVEKGIRKLKK